jgi:hypothetical protein
MTLIGIAEDPDDDSARIVQLGPVHFTDCTRPSEDVEDDVVENSNAVKRNI